jgi:hypothetical protein
MVVVILLFTDETRPVRNALIEYTWKKQGDLNIFKLRGSQVMNPKPQPYYCRNVAWKWLRESFDWLLLL